MITAVDSDTTRFSAEIAGARQFFRKPVDIPALQFAIEQLLTTPTSSPAK